MAEINITLSSDRIRAKAGDKVRIKATFDKLAFASVNERREKAGYQNVIRTVGKVQGIDIEALVHEDTTDFIVMTDANQVPHLNENQNAVAAWYHITIIDDPQPQPQPVSGLALAGGKNSLTGKHIFLKSSQGLSLLLLSQHSFVGIQKSYTGTSICT